MFPQIVIVRINLQKFIIEEWFFLFINLLTIYGIQEWTK